MSSKLAIMGGKPVRKKPFPKSYFTDEEEIRLTNEALNNKVYSRYVGGTRSDIEKILILKSKDTFKYNLPYWNQLGGEMVRKFEKNFAEYHDIDYAIAVNSATSGLMAVLGALNLEPGSEVLIPAYSFSATALSCIAMNCVPKFVDIELRTYCISVSELEKKISKNTKAILVVHLLGNCADIDEIQKIANKFDLPIIEDCAQSIGVSYKEKLTGTMGSAGVFSFQETKNIMTGEGGMIITKDPKIAKKCRLIRNHGENVAQEDWLQEELTNLIGYNFRMTELTAALGIAQLKKLDHLNKVRKENVEYLNSKLRKFEAISPPHIEDGVDYIPHMLAYQYNSEMTGIPRKVILKALKDEGIICSFGYAKPMYGLAMFQKQIAFGSKGWPFSAHADRDSLGYDRCNYPNTEWLVNKGFLFIYGFNYPSTQQDMDDIVDAFEKVFGNIEELKAIKEEDISLEPGR